MIYRLFTGGRILRVAGVSLEDPFLRISIIDRRFGIIKPVKSEDIKLPLSQQERLSVIRETFKRLKEKYKTEGIATGLNFNNFTHHIIDMPLLSNTDMRNALLYELEKYLPLPPEEYIFDFFITKKVQNKSKVLVLSIKKDRLDGILSAVKDLGLNLIAIRCSFIEAINEFVISSRINNAVFVYAAEDSYHVVVLKEQVPVLLRTVLKGKDIISELGRLGEQISGSSIYVSGSPEPHMLDKLNAKTFSLSLPNAVALSAIKRRGFKLNFMPAELLPKKKDYYPYAMGALTVLTVVLLFFNAVYSYYKDYAAMRDIEKRIEQIKGQASGLLEIKRKMESIYEKKKFLYEFQRKRNLNIKVLTELSRILPKDAWLTAMSVDEKGKIEIEGFAKRAAGIIEPLSKSELFTKVEFVSPIVSQDGQERFSIRVLLRLNSKENVE